MQKRVILIKSNLIDRDSRMLKEWNTLRNEGYPVTLLCWDRERETASSEPGKTRDRYPEILLRLKAPVGVRILSLLPIWWCFVFIHLMRLKWDIAHVINFDSIIPATIAAKLRGKPVIYEIEDAYVDEIVLPKVVRYICIQVDKLFMRLAKAVIVIDEAQVGEFGGIPNSRIVPVYDTPANTFDKIDISPHKNEAFTLFYAGFFFKARRMNLDKIFAAIKNIEGVKVVIAGSGDQVEEIKEWSGRMPDKIEFLGFISPEEVLQWSTTANLLFVARTPEIAANKYNCGSTFLRALMFGRPFLANQGTATGDKVVEENCGLVVDANNAEEIREAIVKLKDNPELCKELGTNGRRAYEQRYSWKIMEERLLSLYQELSN